jgi:hypothetical protein
MCPPVQPTTPAGWWQHHDVTESTLISFPYLVLTPGGKLTLLDAVQIAEADEGNLEGQIHSLVGWATTTTPLFTPAGPLLVVHDEAAHADTGLPDNPSAREAITALGGEDKRRGGVHVFCAAASDGALAGLVAEQIDLISATVDRSRVHSIG